MLTFFVNFLCPFIRLFHVVKYPAANCGVCSLLRGICQWSVSMINHHPELRCRAASADAAGSRWFIRREFSSIPPDRFSGLPVPDSFCPNPFCLNPFCPDLSFPEFQVPAFLLRDPLFQYYQSADSLTPDSAAPVPSASETAFNPFERLLCNL